MNDGRIYIQSSDIIVQTANWNYSNGELYPISETPTYNYIGFGVKEIHFTRSNAGYSGTQTYIGVIDASYFYGQTVTATSGTMKRFDQEGNRTSITDITVVTNTPYIWADSNSHEFEAVLKDNRLTVKCEGTTLLDVIFSSSYNLKGVGFLNYNITLGRKIIKLQKNVDASIDALAEYVDEIHEQAQENTDTLNALGTYSNPQPIYVDSLSTEINKYWGNGGLSNSNSYVAVSQLIHVGQNDYIYLYDFGLYNGTSTAAIGMYDNDGNDAPGRVNFNNSNCIKELEIENSGAYVKYAKIKPSASCTQVGLFYKTDSSYTKRPYFKIGDTYVTLSEDVQTQVRAMAQDVVDSSTMQAEDINADYYDKGNAPKLARTKKLCIIGAGQSNIDGRNSTSDLPSGITLPMTGMKYIRNDLNGVFLDEFTANPDNKWGFDLVTCHELINNLGTNELYYIKWANGGTSIDLTGDSSKHWTPDYETLTENASLIYLFNKEIAKCIAVNQGDFEIGAMIWHQGEGDRASYSAAAAANYYTNLKKVIAYCRGIAGNAILPFICGTISHSSAQYDSTVEAATLRIAQEDPYVWVVDMSDAILQDSFHFNAAWSEYFGKKVYDCLIDAKIITGTKLNPQKPT